MKFFHLPHLKITAQRLLVASSLLVLYFFLPILVEAQVLEQRVKSSFQPSTSFLLWSPTKGRVISQQAVVISSLSQPQEYVVGTEGIFSKGTIAPYCFFLKGRDASFAATPVRVNDTTLSSPTLDEIEKENTSLQVEQIGIKNKLTDLQKQLIDLRGKAMLVGGVDSIIQLQTEINS